MFCLYFRGLLIKKYTKTALYCSMKSIPLSMKSIPLSMKSIPLKKVNKFSLIYVLFYFLLEKSEEGTMERKSGR
jgi:hypothetical protein